MTGTYKHILSVDIETYSDEDITNGVYRYVDTPAFEVLLFGYAFDDEEPDCIDICSGEDLPQRVKDALLDPTVEKHAFNAQFERTCINKFWHIESPINQWWCTAVHARMFGLPNTLKEVARILKLDEQKDKAGTLLINYFSKPCTPSASNSMRTRNLPAHDMDKWNLFIKYNKQDVATERCISEYLNSHYTKDLQAEKENYWVDQQINDYGVKIDQTLVNNIIEYNDSYKAGILNRAIEITGLSNPNSLAQLKPWLIGKGLPDTPITKDTLPDLIEQADDPDVKEVLRIRQELSKTSVVKYERMRDAMCHDGRVHGTILFYGAARTGRYAGRIIQVQNFPQNHMDELDEVRNAVLRKDWGYLTCMYDDIQDVFKQLLRTALVAPEGSVYCVADYSAIEARVIAWMAHEEWAEEVFHKGGKIYESTASMMFGVPIEKIKKGNPEYALRQRGKVATLACSYGGGAAAMERMDVKHMIDPSEYQDCVNKWRKANPHIVKFWAQVNDAVRSCLSTGQSVTLDRFKFRYADGNMFIRLPSGRWLTYIGMHVDEKNELRYWGNDAKGWVELHTHGGKITENICQSVARDELACAIRRVEAAGFHIVFHIHDEIIAEVDENEEACDTFTGLGLESMKNLMSAGNDWDKGLWLPAAGYTTKYYKKD